MLHPCKVFPAGAILLALSLVTAPIVASAREAATSTPPQVDMSQSTSGNHSGPALSAGLPEILKMLDAKVDSETIKAFIQNSTMSYHPSAEELILLKEHGAPSDVLKALLEHRAVAPAAVAPTYAPNAAQVAPTYANGEMPNYDYSNPDYSAAAYPYYSPYYPYYYPYSYYWPYFSVGWYWPYYYGCYHGYYGHYHGYCGTHWGHNGFVVHGTTGFHGNNGFVVHSGSFNGHTAGFAHTAAFAPHGGGGFAAHGSGGFAAARGGGGFAGHMGGGGFGGGHGGGGGHR
jgi:hypothetical protein